MKYLISSALFFLSISTLSCQNLTESKAKKMLQGLWQLSTDHKITIAISGDSLMEYNIKTREMGVYACELLNKPCDSEVFTPSPTGIFFSIESEDDDNEGELCAALTVLDNRHFKLQLDKNTIIQFEKLL